MIAVFDIGQSKTLAGIFTESGSLVSTTGFSGRDQIFSEFEDLRNFLQKNYCKSIILGIAGLSRLDETWKSRFFSVAQKVNISPSDIHFYSDAAFLGFQLPINSLGISIGTGSVIINKDKNGTLFIYGGWGYLFGDELSGTWWFKETVRQALSELEAKSAEPEVLDWLCRQLEIIPERSVLIRSVYAIDRENQARLGSGSLSAFGSSTWMKKKMTEGMHSFLGPVKCDFSQVYLQGGLLLSSNLLKTEIIQTVKGMNETVSIETVESLLPGGFLCWKSL